MREEGTAQQALAILIGSLADNKYFLGKRYAEWCTAAPTLESAVAAAAMAQDEIGHARSLYPVLKDLTANSPESEPETRQHFCNASFLNRAFQGWTDFVAANFLFDTALSTLLSSARESSSQALAQRARRILEEEELHWLHGEGWTRRLASKGPAVLEALGGSINLISGESLGWFDVAGEALVHDGQLVHGSVALRSQFRERVNPVLSTVGLPCL